MPFYLQGITQEDKTGSKVQTSTPKRREAHALFSPQVESKGHG